MTLKKMVDGVEMECTPEEEAEIRARWAEYEKNYALRQKAEEAHRVLASQYPNLHKAVHQLYQHLGITHDIESSGT